jgi:hypothetical protein
MRQGATRKSRAFGVDCSKAPGVACGQSPPKQQANRRQKTRKSYLLLLTRDGKIRVAGNGICIIISLLLRVNTCLLKLSLKNCLTFARR